MISRRIAYVMVALVGVATPGLAAPAGKAAPPLLPGGNSKDPVTIDAAKLDYFDKEQKLVYSGGVLAKQGESQLKATTLTIYMLKQGEGEGAPAKGAVGPAAGNSSVRRMEAAGPVTIISKDQVGTGDNGVYDKIANKIYLTGHVALSQGTNITKGDTLTYDLTTSQAVVTGSAARPVSSLFTPGSGAEPGLAAPPKKPKTK